MDAASSDSKTALMVCAYRARASARAGAIMHDPWAAALAGDDGARFAAEYDAVNPTCELYVAVRTAFFDAQVKRYVLPTGLAAQVVLLGAGFDVRAARLRSEGVRFFEVDHPHTQAEKLARLRALDGYPVDCATYVGCDFERDDFLDRLVAEGFDASAPAVFVWEGVVFYLTEQAVRSTLRRIASGCHASTVVTFDYVGKKVVQGSGRSDDEAVRGALRDLGEPLRFGCDDMLPLLYEEAFRHVRLTSFDEACLHFTGTYERARKFRFQHLAVASRAPPVEP